MFTWIGIALSGFLYTHGWVIPVCDYGDWWC